MKDQGTVVTGNSVNRSFRVTFCDELEDALRNADMVFATTPTYALHQLFTDMKALYDGLLIFSAGFLGLGFRQKAQEFKTHDKGTKYKPMNI
ncbi:hypothetical protein F4802DRAFT_597530 [Xylaria palmicola]|nr:hypothetical protein F4802DRAFT_597530 [Xylaria palmicola]